MKLLLSDFDFYQSKALSFRLDTATPKYALLNLSGEVGELHSLLAKGIRDGKKPNHSELIKKELGDILWCLAAVAHDNGFALSDVAEANISKLSSRKTRDVLSGSGDLR